MKTATLTACLIGIVGLLHAGDEIPAPPPGTALIGGGNYKPLYAKEAPPRTVEPFFMDITQVTNTQFLDFVTKHPAWRRSKVQPTLADANYLRHWAGDLDLGAANRDGPVTHVSWFAAKACPHRMNGNSSRAPTAPAQMRVAIRPSFANCSNGMASLRAARFPPWAKGP